MIKQIEKLKKSKNAVILAHYYAPADVQAVADYVGDSFYLAKAAKQSGADVIVFCGVRFIVCTEVGVNYKLSCDNPTKHFYYPEPIPCCADMKLNTLEAVLSVLSKEDHEIMLERQTIKEALLPLERMLRLG